MSPERSEKQTFRDYGFTHSRTRHQTLCLAHGARRRIARHPPRLGLRASGPQRSGQNDPDPHHQPHHGARFGPRAVRRPRDRPGRCLPHRLSPRGARALQENEGRRTGRLLRTPQRSFAPRSRRAAEGVVRQIRHSGVVGQEGRRALEGHGPEGAVHRHGAPRTQAADLRRALFGLRPHQRQPAERGDSGAARQGRHGDLLDAQHVLRGGDLRPHHAHQQIAQHPLGQGR